MHTQRQPTEVSAGDLAVPEELSRRRLRSRLLFAVALVAVVVAVVLVLPGLGSLRSRLAHAKPGWLALGVALKLASGLGYVVVFRMIFCRRMSWRVSYQIGMSELGANALFPTGGAGGLALGAWALKRGGMRGEEIARRTVAFFLLTSVPNVLGVILLGLALAVGIFAGEQNPLLTVLPALVAVAAVAATLLAGRIGGALGRSSRRPLAGRARRAKARAAQGSERPRRGSAGGARVAARGQPRAHLRPARLSRLRRADPVGRLSRAGGGALAGRPLTGVPDGELGGLIPVPGGIGGVDAGLVGTLALYHVSLTSAVGAVLAYRAIALWVPAVAGGTAFMWLRRTLREEAAAVAVCAPQGEMEVIGLGRVVVRAE